MVYCGKPSRGCQMCRTRRIKCDETKPTCNQCAKSRRQCPGYKDEFDLVFRNETKATERRVQKASRKVLSQTKDSSNPSSSLTRASTTKGTKSSVAIRPTLTLPVEQTASCHFVANYILLPRQDGTRGFNEHIIPLLKAETSGSLLHHAFNACAMASLGNRPDAPGSGSDLMSHALGHYTKALSATHLALRDPELSKADATLAAVLLLGLFENITAKKMGMFAWGSHTEGAIQLVKIRGRKQLRTKTGFQLFIAVRTQMIIHSLSTATPPVMGVEWWLSDAVTDEGVARCQRLAIKTAEIRAESARLASTMPHTPENVEVMLDMIRRAQTIDHELVIWLQNPPEYFEWKTVTWEDNVPDGDYEKAEVFPGRVDIYHDVWNASIVNMARVLRLILANIIVRCAAWVCSPVDYRTTPEYATAARTCVDNITDIIASVPYSLGWHLKHPEILKRANLSGFACGEDDSLKGLPGYFLTWPLANVYGQDYATDAQRAWVAGRLKFIGDELGVKYAHLLSQLKLRVPSMLIRRDALMANAQGLESHRLLAARQSSAKPGSGADLLSQLQAMQLDVTDQNQQHRVGPVAKDTGAAGQSGGWVSPDLRTP